jgi:hypothetical protein
MTGRDAARALTFEQLAQLREKTERLSKFLSERLKNHLNTLYPVLAPRRVFGRYLGSKEVIARAEEAYTQLVEKYREVSGSPFELRSDFDEEALSAMENGIEVHPWEYTRQAGDKTITISSPVRWVITYRSDYSLSEMRRLIASKGERRRQAVRHFLVNALTSQIVISQNPDTVQLWQICVMMCALRRDPAWGNCPCSQSVRGFHRSGRLMT